MAAVQAPDIPEGSYKKTFGLFLRLTYEITPYKCEPVVQPDNDLYSEVLTKLIAQGMPTIERFYLHIHDRRKFIRECCKFMNPDSSFHSFPKGDHPYAHLFMVSNEDECHNTNFRTYTIIAAKLIVDEKEVFVKAEENYVSGNDNRNLTDIVWV